MTLQYTPDHEWLQTDTNPVGVGDIVTVGITHHAQDALGDVVFVDLPEVGKTLAAREVAGVVWPGRSDLASPAALRPITEVLDSLAPLSQRWCELVEFAARYYQRSSGEVALAVLPPNTPAVT